MQSTSVTFKRLSISDVRPIRADVFIDFRKNYIIGKPGSYDWDKYDYQNYSSRLVNVEWVRECQEYASVHVGMLDIILDNHDGLFSPNGGSLLSSYILPNRPIKIYSGFGSEVIQSFVGLTDGMPTFDEKERTVTFHAVDFLSYFLKKSLDESSIFVGKRTDEIIESLFNDQGILDAQMSLDKGFNIIPYAYTSKGDILGDVLFKLIEAEGGRLFMDEDGRITFRNRQNWDSSPKLYLNPYRGNMIVDSIPRGQDDFINVVQIEGKIREVQPLQPYGQITQSVLVPANGTAEVWIEFPEPVTSFVDPVYIASSISSLFEVNTHDDGSGSPAIFVSLIDSVLLSGTTLKLTFSNSQDEGLWITRLVVYATPAIVTQNFYIREEDESSVGLYGEKILSINNDYFGDDDEARSKALIILRGMSSVGEVRNLEIKGDMSLQVDDCVHIDLYNVHGNYRVIKIINKIGLPGKFTQLITVGRLLDFGNYFTINQSAIFGPDMIAP